jgi:diaminohydroxyphosphoribosylaminopyrimidine deaminase/5-amino-6-(5-phosphoribosylamino)uracil reductase
MPSQQSPDSSNQQWDQFLLDFFQGAPLTSSALQAIFQPLRRPAVDDMVILGQMGQTLDGRIATVSGQSKIHQWERRPNPPPSIKGFG